MKIIVSKSGGKTTADALLRYLNYIKHKQSVKCIVTTDQPFNLDELRDWCSNNNVTFHRYAWPEAVFGPYMAEKLCNDDILKRHADADMVILLDTSSASSDLLSKALSKGIKVVNYGKFISPTTI